MDWCPVSTIYTAFLLLLSSPVSVHIGAMPQAVESPHDAIAPQVLQVAGQPQTVFSYQPRRDIGRPRRTGPSGGRFA